MLVDMAIKQKAVGYQAPTRPVWTDILAVLASSTLARFLVVGAGSYVINQAALYGLYEHFLTGLRGVSLPLAGLDASLFLASALAVELSIVVRFLLNDRWTFAGRSAKPFRRRLYESNLSSLASPVISLVAVNLLTPLLGISYLLANSAGILLGLAWNWSWSTRVVWQRIPTAA